MPDVKNKIAKTYYPGMDALRGIAVLLVIYYHNFSIMPFSEFGFLGVDLFFVISGFLITDILINGKESGGSIRNFYIRRILRIFPVYYSALLFLIFFLPFFFRVSYDLQYYRANQYWFYIFIQNWLFILKPLENKFLLNHFWSLAIEEQFYLLWPLIIFVIAKKNSLLSVTTGLFMFIFLARLILLYVHVVDKYMLAFTFLRFDGLLIGCSLALFIRQDLILTKKILGCIFVPLIIINTAFFIAVFLLKKNLSYFPCIGYTTFSLLFGLAVYGVVCKGNTNFKKIITAGPLHFFGRISYGLYIYHWPVFILLYPLIKTALRNHLNLSSSICFIISAVITTLSAILLSMLSHRYFESFFLSLKRKFV